MSGDRRPTMPPVRLLSDAELARDALAAPLVSRAARLARWAGTGVPVGAGGELLAGQLSAAAEELGLLGDEDGLASTAESWHLAVDLGLIEIDELATGEPAADRSSATDRPSATERPSGAGAPQQVGTELAGAEQWADGDQPVGVARTGAELAQLTGGSPSEVLEIWRAGVESVLVDAASPSFEELFGSLEELAEGAGPVSSDSVDLGNLDWNQDEELAFLDSALGNLYRLTVTDASVSAGAMVPLPVLAASVVVPPEMEEPTDEVLEEVSAAMMKLDTQFRLLEPTGLVTYQPVDEALIADPDHLDTSADTGVFDSPVTDDDLVVGQVGTALPSQSTADGALDDEDVTRYGMVRLTPLGRYGMRGRLLDAGVAAPAVGELADKGADVLLDALPGHAEDAAQAEVERWLARRAVPEAARELLSAARGDDPSAPQRRLYCQQALSLAGAPAEPAVREVLDDRHLGGLARVWLAEQGAADVPPPSQELVFWLTVDTLAAQLAADGGSAELVDLVQGLVDQHTGFFDRAWRVPHPATARVLEAMGQLHPDRATAKEARKAAFKARSRPVR